MTSYLATIRFEAEDDGHAERKCLDAVVSTGADRWEIHPAAVQHPNVCPALESIDRVVHQCSLPWGHAGGHAFKNRIAAVDLLSSPESSSVPRLSPAVLRELRREMRRIAWEVVDERFRNAERTCFGRTIPGGLPCALVNGHAGGCQAREQL